MIGIHCCICIVVIVCPNLSSYVSKVGTVQSCTYTISYRDGYYEK